MEVEKFLKLMKYLFAIVFQYIYNTSKREHAVARSESK